MSFFANLQRAKHASICALIGLVLAAWSPLKEVLERPILIPGETGGDYDTGLTLKQFVDVCRTLPGGGKPEFEGNPRDRFSLKCAFGNPQTGQTFSNLAELKPAILGHHDALLIESFRGPDGIAFTPIQLKEHFDLLFARTKAQPSNSRPLDAEMRANKGPRTGLIQENSYSVVANTQPPDAFLALRTQPSSFSGRRITAMLNGTRLTVLQKRADGWWLVRVVDTGEEGWALSIHGQKTFIECCVTAAATLMAPNDVATEQAQQRPQEYSDRRPHETPVGRQTADGYRSLVSRLDTIAISIEDEGRMRAFCDTVPVTDEADQGQKRYLLHRCKNNLSRIEELKAERVRRELAAKAAAEAEARDQEARRQAAARAEQARIEAAEKAEQEQQARAKILATLSPELRTIIEQHPEFRPDRNSSGTLAWYSELVGAEMTLEVCTERAWFSPFGQPLAEVRRRKKMLEAILQVQGVTPAKIAEMKASVDTGKEQGKAMIRTGRENPEAICNYFVMNHSLNQAW